MTTFVHGTALVEETATLGEGCSIWHEAHVRRGATLGRGCVMGKGSFVDFDVQVGDHCKLQNGAYVYHGATLEDGVFVGPRACFTNDRFPRAINPDGSLKNADDWQVGETRACFGASIGAGAIVLPGVRVGRFAMVASGAVVSRDVPDQGLVMGVPARLSGFACVCGVALGGGVEDGPRTCPSCQRKYQIDALTCRELAANLE